MALLQFCKKWSKLCIKNPIFITFSIGIGGIFLGSLLFEPSSNLSVNDITSFNAVRGNIIEVSPFFNYEKVSIRLDCKNPECEIKQFFVEKNNKKSGIDNDLLVALSVKNKVIIDYKGSFFRIIDAVAIVDD